MHQHTKQGIWQLTTKTHIELIVSKKKTIFEEKKKLSMNVKDAIETRSSVRRFTEVMPSEEELTKIMEAGRMAPSAVNRQPWRFVCIRSEEGLSAIRKTYPREWFATAKAVIAVIVDHNTSWHRGVDGKDHADIDAAIAADHMILMATELGLGTCWVCNFDAAEAHRALNLSESEEVEILIPTGYAATDSTKPKSRKEAAAVYTFI